MNTRPFAHGTTIAIVTQLVSGVGALYCGTLVHLPLMVLVLMGFTLGCGLAASTGSSRVTLRHGIWLRRVSWVCSAGAWGLGIWAHDRFLWLDAATRAMAWLVAASFVAGHLAIRKPTDWRWMPAMAWAWGFSGGLLWLGAAYQQNHAPAFYGGLLLMLGLGIVLRLWVRPPGVGIHAAHTLILLALGLPITDWWMASAGSAAVAEIADRPYAYETARRDPGRFAAWWRTYQAAWECMARDVFTADPEQALPLRLRPGAKGFLMESPIVINRHGFRGSDWDEDPPHVYRIVALGESTTFGCTLRPTDRPWPELLEDWIREELRPQRLIRVINAGVPAYDIGDNLRRFERDLIGLRPDLIISYHGYNGFHLLRDAVPPVAGDIGPLYRQRPLLLLAQVEYRLRRRLHSAKPAVRPSHDPAAGRPLLETDYAAHYKELLRKADATGARLALCTFSMAVDAESADDFMEFYRSVFPAVRWQVKANQAHSRLLREFQEHHEQVLVIDTQPDLNGRHEHFIDLVHLTQEGRQRLARSIFDGLKPILREELGPHEFGPTGTAQE
jgi:lysophospholipase L1-like esterase